VKKAIDDMVTQLLAEKKDEIKHKDFCVEEINTIQLQTERKDREREDLIALIEDLNLTIKTLSADIDSVSSGRGERCAQTSKEDFVPTQPWSRRRCTVSAWSAALGTAMSALTTQPAASIIVNEKDGDYEKLRNSWILSTRAAVRAWRHRILLLPSP